MFVALKSLCGLCGSWCSSCPALSDAVSTKEAQSAQRSISLWRIANRYDNEKTVSCGGGLCYLILGAFLFLDSCFLVLLFSPIISFRQNHLFCPHQFSIHIQRILKRNPRTEGRIKSHTSLSGSEQIEGLYCFTQFINHNDFC